MAGVYVLADNPGHTHIDFVDKENEWPKTALQISQRGSKILVLWGTKAPWNGASALRYYEKLKAEDPTAIIAWLTRSELVDLWKSSDDSPQPESPEGL